MTSAMSLEEQELILPSSGETELDVFRNNLNAAFYPAFVDIRGTSLNSGRLAARSLGRTTLGFVRFGAEAVVDPGHIDSYHVNVALAGSVASEYGSRSVIARPGMAAVFGPDEHTRLPSWSRDAAQLCVKIDRRALHSELEAMLGRQATNDIAVDIALPTEGGAGRRWLETLLFLLSIVNSDSFGPRVVDHVERAMLAQLLFAARHSYRDELDGPTRYATPNAIRKVIALIDESPFELFTVVDLARHAGVSVRRLEQSFQSEVGMSPSRYLAQKRLSHAHDDLSAPRPGDTVTDVMYRWGFSNHARFAAAYRSAFHRNPSETLRDALGELP